MIEEKTRYAGRRVENLGSNVTIWCMLTGNGSSTVDLCKTHAEQLDKNPHHFDNILRRLEGDPLGDDGWGGDVEHPSYYDCPYYCVVPTCGVLLGD